MIVLMISLASEAQVQQDKSYTYQDYPCRNYKSIEMALMPFSKPIPVHKAQDSNA